MTETNEAKANGLMSGTTEVYLPAGGAGEVAVDTASGLAMTMTVHNPWSTAVPSGRRVQFGYILNRCRWEVTAADIV